MIYLVNKVALSFSGGKDSCLALYELQQRHIEVACLITTVWTENLSSVAHGEDLEKLKDQARALNIPIHFARTTFESYLDDFVEQLQIIKQRYHIDGIAFGDIYIAGHRAWGEDLAAKVQLKPIYPLWNEKENMLNMLQQFVDLGFQAEIIKIDPEKLPENWLGRRLDQSFISDIAAYKNVCPMGESGEYHTTVFAGPIFQEKQNL